MRTARPDDYDAIAAVVNDWWGRPVLAALPRLFLDHFYRTSLVADGLPGAPGPEATPLANGASASPCCRALSNSSARSDWQCAQYPPTSVRASRI